MNASADFIEIPPFQVITNRIGQQVPFVFNSPHSGSYYPARFLAMSKLDEMAIRRSEDCYVDQLFFSAVHVGAVLLCANFPRAYLDANREPWELDPRMFSEPLPPFANTHSARVAGGLGTVPKLVGDGYDIYHTRLPVNEATSRIELYYQPYHACLGELLGRTQESFGHAILVDCHSMPRSIRVAQGNISPDIIIGDRFGTSASQPLTRLAVSLLAAKGYSVELNRPYAGGFITEHYGRPAQNIHAFQIEVNRGLYMNEKTLEPTDNFETLASDLADFTKDFIEISRGFLPVLPMAAE